MSVEADRYCQVTTHAVYAPGCRVEIGTHKSPVKALVLEASIGAEGAVRYRVAWWDGRHRRQEWLDSCEIVWAPEAPQIDVVHAGGA